MTKQMGQVSKEFAGIGFADVDVDECLLFAKEIGVLNVPAVAYFRDHKLFALIIGVKQDVRMNIMKLMEEA